MANSNSKSGKLRVHIWGINYAPEVTGIAVYNIMLAEWLADQGHTVEVVSTFPYYPSWKKMPGDSGLLYRSDELKGVMVHRCWHYVPGRVTTLKRIVHEASFVCTSFLRILTLPRADVVFVASPPLLLGAAAWLLRLLRKSPYVFHVQDLQPDAAVGLGMMKKGLIIRLLYALEAFSYTKANRLSGIGKGMLDAFRKKGVPAEKTLFFPNAAPLGNLSPAATPPQAGKKLSHESVPTTPTSDAKSDFLVVYSGNLGVKQGLDSVLEAFAQTSAPELRFVICGEGAMRTQLEHKAAELRLDQLQFSDLLPELEYAELLQSADICLVPQSRGSGASFLPSKLLSILAKPKPVLAVADADSELSRAVMEGKFGILAEPEKPAELAAILDSLPQRPAELLTWAQNGMDFVRPFGIEPVHRTFEQELRAVAATKQRDGKSLRPRSAPSPKAIAWLARGLAVLLTVSLISVSLQAEFGFADAPILPAWLEHIGEPLWQAGTFVPCALYSLLLPFMPLSGARQLSLRNLGAGTALVASFLISTELIQSMMSTRYFSLPDLAWGALGIVLGSISGSLIWLICSRMMLWHKKS